MQEWTPEYRLIVEELAAERIFQVYKLLPSKPLFTEFNNYMKLTDMPEFNLNPSDNKRGKIRRIAQDIFDNDSADVRQIIVEMLANTKNLIEKPKSSIAYRVMETEDRGDFTSYIKNGKQLGAEVRGLCPFHNDSQASFSGNSDTGLWFCFAGCGSGTWSDFMDRLKPS